jgi:Glyoxalase-like domain
MAHPTSPAPCVRADSPTVERGSRRMTRFGTAGYAAFMELDHVFCMVDPAGDWAHILTSAGLALDQGNRHPGQGTRNRRVPLESLYLELLWVCDRPEAAGNALRLDRRADWARTGASPFGVGLRGRVPEHLRDDYWLYSALGFPLWVHRDNENAPERPMVFVLDLPSRRDTAIAIDPAGLSTARVRSIHLRAASAAPIPAYTGPPVVQTTGPDHMDLVLENGPDLAIREILALRPPTRWL